MGISLKKGDIIGVAAPSARFDRRLFDKGLGCLNDMGFRTRVHEEIFGKLRYLAGTDRARAGIVSRLFLDPEVKAVISVRGGFGAMRILDFLDWDTIRRNPTLFIGFSDATALIAALVAKEGVEAVHGPNLVSLAKANQTTLEGVYRALTGALTEIAVPDARCLAGGRAKGRLVGGNLATLVHMIGTPYQPDFSGGILFLEDVGEPAYKIDRMLSQMKMAGCFASIKGVVTGSFEDCANPDYIPEIVSEVFGGMDIPVMMGLESGHGETNRSLIMGQQVVMDADRSRIIWENDA
ncbi:MAG TPA: LD-carboxypeptidase [Desulfobacteraceae bacterium]|nr:LD-carboxypeptidase [Desulfobacteraceae bacterium]